MADPDYNPSKKACKRKLSQISDINCVICNGVKGNLSEEESKRSITDKGLTTLLQTCKDRGDDAARRIVLL